MHPDFICQVFSARARVHRPEAKHADDYERESGFRPVEQRLFSIESEAASFPMHPDAPRVLVGFDLAAWLAGLDLASATVDDEGVRVLSPERNPELLAEFEAALASGAALYRDADESGEVSSDASPIARAR